MEDTAAPLQSSTGRREIEEETLHDATTTTPLGSPRHTISFARDLLQGNMHANACRGGTETDLAELNNEDGSSLVRIEGSLVIGAKLLAVASGTLPRNSTVLFQWYTKCAQRNAPFFANFVQHLNSLTQSKELPRCA